MSKVVFTLGAGASADAGAPLMANFLDVADEIQDKAEAEIDKESFALVAKARSALQSVHSKALIDLDNIESLFAAFEMAQLFGRKFGSLNEADVENLGRAIRRLIVQTLEHQIQFPVAGSGQQQRRVLPPPPYGRFMDLLHKRLDMHKRLFSIITFNYDLALDYALHFAGESVDYCLDPAQSTGLPLMKLHGSMNWGRCAKEDCGKIVPWTLRDYFQRRSYVHLYDVEKVRLDLARHLGGHLHCNHPVQDDPFIVPPTWNKTQHYHEIWPVWQRAAQHLSEAEVIVVFGYSLPETDQFFRYLYALGTVGDTILKCFIVVDPDPSDQVMERFQSLLGPGVKNRFIPIKKTFADALDEVFSRRELQKFSDKRN
jgi:NAD-dependent SIR2 family protein deacetylase